MRFSRIVNLFLWIALLLGCDKGFSFEGLPKQMTLEIYRPSGEMISSLKIDPSDAIYNRLQNLLYKERNGWKIDFVSRTPIKYIFRSEGLIVRVFNDFIVVDQIKKDRSRSFRKVIPDVINTLGLPNVEQEKSKDATK